MQRSGLPTKKFDDAIDAEDEAVALVERTIEEGGR